VAFAAPHFSPDGKWVAYRSNETGHDEVFVQNFPWTGAKYQVSLTGGDEPRWRRDGRELFFLAPDGRLMSVEVEQNPALRFGPPKPLFQTRLMELPGPSRRYGVTADGQRFLMSAPAKTGGLSPIVITTDWRPLLDKR
jgi:hypothetical protein